VFSVEDRDRVRDRVLELAAADPRLVAGAVVGSLAQGPGDRWSDLDLTFGVSDEVPLGALLEDWTDSVAEEFDALQLFDLPAGPAIYRVFLLPNGLQLDLSFSPASEFAATSPRFRLLFGESIDRPGTPRAAADIFGWGVVYALHARRCVERGRLWQAEYCVGALRDHALDLACRRRDLPVGFGRGFDALPPQVLAAFDDALVRSLGREDLLRALECAIQGLLREAVEVRELAAKVEAPLRTFVEHAEQPL